MKNIIAGLGLVGLLDCRREPQEQQEEIRIEEEQISKEQESDATLPLLEQFQQFEREQRTMLYDALIQGKKQREGSERDSLVAVLQNMPQILSYLDKWNPPNRIRVESKTYLFDARSVQFDFNHPDKEYQGLAHNPDSYSLHVAIELGSPLCAYDTNLRDKISELGLSEEEGIIEQFLDVKMMPFYESIRNPTKEDLIKLYKFVDDAVPKFMVDALSSQSVEKDIKKARELVEADPSVYRATELIMKGKGGYSSAQVSPKDERYPVSPSRYENGELRVPSSTMDGTEVRRRDLIFAEKYERQSPLTKWLYRRGSGFIDNFEIMLGQYRTSTSINEFVDGTLVKISEVKR